MLSERYLFSREDKYSRARVLVGIAGASLSQEESEAISELRPYGIILFNGYGKGVNTENAIQIKCLTDEIKRLFLSIGYEPMISIDQEGCFSDGRYLATRIKAPEYLIAPSSEEIGSNPNLDEALSAVYKKGLDIGRFLREVGVNINNAPASDLLRAHTATFLRPRLFSQDPERTVLLSRSFVRGHLDSGIEPVLKHMPGHGCASVDTHFSVARVQEGLDQLMQGEFKVFQDLAGDFKYGMVSHVVYECLDNLPASQSKTVISFIRGWLGFKGVLFTDAMEMMGAGGDSMGATYEALQAGCDIALLTNPILTYGKIDRSRLL